MTWYDVRDWLRINTTRALLWLVGAINRYKDRDLAWRLHRMADHYDTRPTGEWEG